MSTTIARIDAQEWRYWAAVAFVSVPYFIFAILALILGSNYMGAYHFGDINIPYSYLALTVQTLYHLASIRLVRANEVGGLLVLEKEAMEVVSGIKFVPLGIVQLFVFTLAFKQEQFPGEPEQISKLPDDDELRTNMLKPIRATTAPSSADARGILDSQLTLEPTFTVLWQIEENLGVFEFYVNIAGDTWEDKYAFILKLMRDAGEKALTIAIAERTTAEVYAERGEIAEEVKNALSKATQNWGIVIGDVNVLGIEPPRDVNVGMAKLAAAKAEAAGIERIADANAHATKVGGQAAAGARRDLLAAEGEGVAAAAAAINMSPSTYREGQLAAEMIGSSTVIVTGDNPLAGALAAFTATALGKGGK